MRVTASAPGKLMLMGDHAVVYGYPCLVTAVDLRYQATVEKHLGTQILLETPMMRKNERKFEISKDALLNRSDFPRAAAFVLAAVRSFYQRYPFEGGLKIRTDGPIISYGLGSSSAVTAATVAALTALHHFSVPNQTLFEIAFDAVLEVQGKGSGFDVASAVYGGTLFYEQGGEVIEPIAVGDLPVVIGFSGEKVSTTDLVEQVSQLKSRNPETVDGIFNMIGKLVRKARYSIESQDWQTLGDLLNLNQGMLDALGVSTLQLSKQIIAAREAGAYGAKLSGAGGGDCMFALAEPGIEHGVSEGIENAGGEIVRIRTGVSGVRIEPN